MPSLRHTQPLFFQFQIIFLFVTFAVDFVHFLSRYQLLLRLFIFLSFDVDRVDFVLDVLVILINRPIIKILIPPRHIISTIFPNFLTNIFFYLHESLYIFILLYLITIRIKFIFFIIYRLIVIFIINNK